MHFALAALLAASPATAFIAWSGWACDGPEGADVPCNGACVGFGGRHSFIADVPNFPHCVALYVGRNCDGQRFNFTNQQGQCTAVNTGTDIQSFQCFPSWWCS
ncbi:hypothetical protein AURDEDRAFT_166581 [Auricularia subglabra TFB-10046 SS5]|nr:hypothetical protein AURDEDRAFT_166581 [Auricularia subglabra TFB-10046 SS5]